MGDHRATVKISLSLPDRDEPRVFDAWINYWPADDYDAPDRRVSEFFAEAWREYYAWYLDKTQPPPPVDPRDARIAELEAQLAAEQRSEPNG